MSAAVNIAATVDVGVYRLRGMAFDVTTAVNCGVDMQAVQLIAVDVATTIDVVTCFTNLAGEVYIATTIDTHADALTDEVVRLDVTTAIDVVMCLAGFASKLYIAAAVDVHADALAGEVVCLDIATAVDVERQ